MFKGTIEETVNHYKLRVINFENVALDNHEKMDKQ